jgi:hypothetical protein
VNIVSAEFHQSGPERFFRQLARWVNRHRTWEFVLLWMLYSKGPLTLVLYHGLGMGVGYWCLENNNHFRTTCPWIVRVFFYRVIAGFWPLLLAGIGLYFCLDWLTPRNRGEQVRLPPLP